MSLNELRGDLAVRSERRETFRDYIRRLHRDDRELFFRLARNRPGPGGSVVDPGNHGFDLISTFREDSVLLRRNVMRAREYANREHMFQAIIELTHKGPRTSTSI